MRILPYIFVKSDLLSVYTLIYDTNVFEIDFAYLIPANSSVRSPLENTMRFSLVFNLDNFTSEALFKSNRQKVNPMINQNKTPK